MIFIKTIWIVCVFILSGFLSSQKLEAKVNSAQYKIYSQSASLTKATVRDYIETSVAVTKLQQKMKSQAGQYDNVIKSFYKKREALLVKRGWTVEDFENTRDRILAAQNAMEQEDNLKSEEEFKKDIAEIKANPDYSDDQKSGIIEIKSTNRSRILEEVIAPTKKDWPAVESYRKELNHLTDYAAQNRSEPPVVK